MCIPSVDPVSTAANVALIGGGAAAGAYGANKTRNEKIINDARQADARNNVLREYLAKQKTLQDENTATADSTIGKFGAPQAQVLSDAQGNRVKTVTDNLAPLSDPSYTDVPLAGDAPAGVKADIAARLRAGFDKALTTTKANAKLGGYGDQWAGNALTTSAAGRNIDAVNSFSRGNTNLLPSLQDAAQYGAYQPASGVGSMFSTAGKLLAGAGGSGFFKPGAAAGGVPDLPYYPPSDL